MPARQLQRSIDCLTKAINPHRFKQFVIFPKKIEEVQSKLRGSHWLKVSASKLLGE